MVDTHEARSYSYLVACMNINAKLINRYSRLLKVRACLCTSESGMIFNDDGRVTAIDDGEYIMVPPIADCAS